MSNASMKAAAPKKEEIENNICCGCGKYNDTRPQCDCGGSHRSSCSSCDEAEEETDEEEDTSIYVVRLERPMYGKDNELIAMKTIEELEFDTIEEAQHEYNNYSIEAVGELLYLDEKDDENDYWENIEGRGVLAHEEEE